MYGSGDAPPTIGSSGVSSGRYSLGDLGEAGVRLRSACGLGVRLELGLGSGLGLGL